jgi:2-polyprenyl-3-methyl-5-hydroxy-6-metoxy-1,4-benzoquinol methylase
MSKVIPCGTKVAMQHAGKPLVSWQNTDAVQAWRCSECGYIYFDTPDLGFLREYYQVKYPEEAKSWYNLKNDWNEDRCEHLASYVRSVARKWIQTDQVFYHESGCAFGGIVRKLNQLGFRATGTELNETAVAEAQAAGNENVHACTDRELFSEKSDRADLVYGFHCLEHMPFPTQYLTELRHILSPRGVALFHVPNAVAANSLLRGFDKNSWFAYPGHLHMFSPSSVICLAESAEFDVLDIRTNLLTDDSSKDAEMLGGADAASIRGRIFNEIIQDGLLGQEICFVITPSGSETAEKYAENIAATRKRTTNFRAREITYLQLQAEDGTR